MKKEITLFLQTLVISIFLSVSSTSANEPVILNQLQLPDSSPAGLAVDGDHFWFVDTKSDTIIKIDPSGHPLFSFASPGENPKGLTFDGTHLWLSESSTNKIYKLSQYGEIIASMETPGNYPRGLAFDGTHLWHADSDRARIYKLDLLGNVVDAFDAPGPSPHGLAFDGNDLWVVDREERMIFKISRHGEILRSFNAPNDSPYGLAFDGQSLWSVEQSGDSLYQLGIAHDLSDTPFFLTTRWGQRDDFARFTPDNHRAGCWSTAFAQILYYYRLQPYGSVRYTTTTGYQLDEDFDATPFDWSLFVDEITESTSEISINEVAQYVYFTAVVIQKDFNTSTYVLSSNQDRIDALESHYDIEGGYHSITDTPFETLKRVIFDEIAQCRPVFLYLTHPDIGHAVVVDGHTTIDGIEYIHINMGGEGINDGWYDIDAPTLLESYEIKRVITLNPLYIDTTSEAFCGQIHNDNTSPDDRDEFKKNLADSNRLFDWAEEIVPEILNPPNAETLETDGIIYRYYPPTKTYMGTLGRDFFLYSPLFNGMLLLGTIDDYLPQEIGS